MKNSKNTIKHSKGSKETMDGYVKRRNKEEGKVAIPETHSHPLAAGRHPLMALQQHRGIVKKGTAKKMEKVAHLRKKRQKEGKAF